MRLRQALHRTLRYLLEAVGWLFLSVFSVVLVAVSLLAFQRHLVADVVSRALEPVFQGSIEITDVEFIAFDRVEGLDARLRDPSGRVVAELHDVEADLPLFSVLDQLLQRTSTLTINLKRVHARYARVDLSTNDQGELRLVEALTPPERPMKQKASSQEVVVRLHSIEFESAWVHGAPSPQFPLDVGVESLSTALYVEGSRLTIGPAHVRAAARVVGPVLGVGVDFRGKSRLNIEVTDGRTTEGAPRIPALLEEIHFSATLNQDESRIELTGDQVSQELSLVAQGKYIPSAQILAKRPVIDVDAQVQGTLDELGAQVRLEADGAKSRLDLTWVWEDELVLQGEWKVDDFSPALLDESAPASVLDAQFQFEARRSPSSRLPQAPSDAPEWTHWLARLDGRLAAFPVAGREIPPLEVQARFNPPEWHAMVNTAREGGRTRVVAQGRVEPSLPMGDLNVSGRLDLSELRSYLPGLRQGTGVVDVSGRLSLARSELRARIEVDLRRVQYQDTLAVSAIRAQGRISGRLSDPHLEATVHAVDLDVLLGTRQERHFEQVDLHGSGYLSSLELRLFAEQKNRTLEAQTRLRVGRPLEIRGTRLILRGEGEPIRLSAARLDIHAGGIRLRDVEFSGWGEGRLSGTVNRQGVALQGYVRNVPLQEIAEGLSLDLKGARGEIDLDADFMIGPGKADGRIRLLVSDASLQRGPVPVRGVPPLDMRLDVIGQGQNLVLVAEVTPTKEPDSVARVDATVDLGIPEGERFKQPNAWIQRVVTVKTRGSLDLEWLPAALLPEHTDLRGRLDFRANLERPSEGAVPSARLFVRTSGLQVALPRQGTVEGQDVAMTTVTGLDFKAQLAHLPERGRTRAWIGVFQGERMLGHVRGRVDATLASLRFPDALNNYRAAPLEVHAHILRTPLDGLPEIARLQGARGTISAAIALTGSFEHPDIRGHAEVQEFSVDRTLRPEPFDARLTFEYARQAASAQLRFVDALSPGENEPLLARAAVTFGSEISESPLAIERVDAQVRLRDFPLASLVPPEVAAGTLSGDMDVKRYGTSQPSVVVDLDLSQMKMEGVSLQGGELRAKVDANSAEAYVNFEGDDYLLRAEMKTDLVWSSLYVPTWDEGATGRVLARRFPLRILRPLVSGTLADLDGKLDAQFRGRLKEGTPVISGRAALTDGSVQFPRLGQQLRDVQAEVEWLESGRIVLEDASFRGITGRGRVDGSAQMEGALPMSAQFQVQVDRTERLPLSIQGLGLGEFWGDVRGRVELSWEDNRVHTEVDFRSFQVAFPEIVTGGVQSLGPDEHVAAGAWVNEEEFVVVPLQPVETKKKEGEAWSAVVEIDLGNDLWVQQGPRRRIQVEGELSVAAEEEVTVEGQLSLSRGRIELNGRMFEVDEGTITFQPEDPGNPIIVAEARWQSPEGTVVIARFLGPVESGEMTLTSEPPLPQDQIVSLLLFGDTSGLNGAADSGGGNNEAQAIVVGGSVATQGLNQALSRVEAIDISTRIDTAESDSVRPEVVIQLTNSVSAQVGYNLEEPSPGESPDRTIVSLEVRLYGGNSVSATLGDRGSAFFDWIWRYRY